MMYFRVPFFRVSEFTVSISLLGIFYLPLHRSGRRAFSLFRERGERNIRKLRDGSRWIRTPAPDRQCETKRHSRCAPHCRTGVLVFKTPSSTDIAYCESGLMTKCVFLFKSSKELTLVVRFGKFQNSGHTKQ